MIDSLERIRFDVPNLDGLWPEELEAIGGVFSVLAAYSAHKQRACEMRTSGDIEAALASERAADKQYQQLPHWARR